MCRYGIKSGGPFARKTFCFLLFSSSQDSSGEPQCSSHQTTRISKNIIMWLVPAGPSAFGSGKTIVCSWATRKKEPRAAKDQFVPRSCQNFSEMAVSWQPQNYFSFPVLDPFNLVFLFFAWEKSGSNTPKESWLQHLLAVWMWTSYFNSLYLSFCICKMGITTYREVVRIKWVICVFKTTHSA